MNASCQYGWMGNYEYSFSYIIIVAQERGKRSEYYKLDLSKPCS
jgi:hypothetical protein